MKLPVENYTTASVVELEEINGFGVVIDGNDDYTFILPIKGVVENRGDFDYVIRKHRDTGIKFRPAMVRCGCMYKLKNDVVLNKVGELKDVDYLGIAILFNEALNSCETLE